VPAGHVVDGGAARPLQIDNPRGDVVVGQQRGVGREHAKASKIGWAGVGRGGMSFY